MKPLVSIIIPVYNVEKYLDKCIASVVGQTYQNLQIILIDDGSTDRSPAICDGWKSRDPRITVVHQPNGGLSRARNAGLELATGEFIGFVDSDDWIEPNMVESMLNACLENDADASCCGYYQEYIDHSISHPLTDTLKHYEGEDIIRSALKGDFMHYAWNKLWRRDLFDDGCRFPPGMYFEDIATGWKAFRKCRRVVCVPDKLYHYIIRKDSICNAKTMKRFADRWIAFKERYDVMATKSEELRQICIDGCLDTIGYTWRWLHVLDRKDRDEETLQEMRAFVKENRDRIAYSPIATRISLFCVLHSNLLTEFGCYCMNQIYRKIHGMDRMM